MLSFFGDDDGKSSGSKGAIITRVAVKRPPPPVRPVVLKKSSSNGDHHKRSTNPTSTSTSIHSNYHQSKMTPQSSSKLHKSHSKPSSNSSSRPSTPSSPARKRKTSEYQPIRPESPSDSDGGDTDFEDGTGTTSSAKKRKRFMNGSGDIVGSQNANHDDNGTVGRKVFCYDKVDMRGEWRRGWGCFVGCEELVRGRDGKMLDKYEAYFPQEGFAKLDMPSVELQYPAPGCREKFILLKPNSAREYSPIDELLRAIKTIVKHYIPPSHSHIFGHFSDPSGLGEDLLPSRIQSPIPQATPPALSVEGTSGSSNSISIQSSQPPIPIPAQIEEPIARALEKSLARNVRDGPGFLRAMERFNEATVDLQVSGDLGRWLDSSSSGIKNREWSELVETVHEQAYNRVVGPFSHELEHHPKHSDEVANAISEKEDAYGELRHNFMSKIIQQTGLGPESVFVDLGSGVGNCVLQASLQGGCRSYGFELLPVPARCARLQVAEVQRRWAMWCLAGNLEVETHEGDFRVHPEVAKRLAEADVVLVNNEVFPESLNHDLTNQFLDLKEGAKIVSLKPFIQEGFRLKENNYGSFSALLRSSSHTYNQGWVSWKGESGRYHIQTIDRSMVKKFIEGLSRG